MFPLQTRTYRAAYTSKPTSADPEIAEGLRWLRSLEDDIGPDILVVAPALSMLELSGEMQTPRRPLRLMSARTFQRRGGEWTGGPAMALWPNAELLGRLDDDRRVKAMVVIPWRLEPLSAWIAVRRAVDLLGQVAMPPKPTVQDPTVEEALKALTRRTYVPSGRACSGDKATIADAFRMLRLEGHEWTGEEVFAWAISHGWSNRGASQLRWIANGVKSGHRFRTGASVLDWDSLDEWRSKAAASVGRSGDQP